jgi:hypothetical protein
LDTVKQRKNLDARFIRLHMSREDFVEARMFLKAFRTRDMTVVRRAVLLAAVVAYARPFSGNKPHQHATEHPAMGNLSADLTSEEVALHDTLVQMRHTVVAHAVYERNFARRVDRPTTDRFMLVQERFDLLDQPIDRTVFESLCAKRSRTCFRQMRELSRQLSELKP